MYRILRSIKNRFGSTAELGIYEMRQDGLRQVSNPSELLLSQDHEGMSGVAIASAIEGGKTLPDRDASTCQLCGLRQSATFGNGIRYSPHEHAAGRIRETCRI